VIFLLIDTHVHLNDERLYQDLKLHIQEANEVNVTKMICIGYDIKSSQKAIEIANQYDGVYASVGIHPSEVKKASINDLDKIAAMLNNKKVVAIGEIGLDYYWDKTFIDLQKEFFIKQLEIAKKYDKPVIIHMREAALDTFDILKQYRLPGVMHCYSGSLEMAHRFIDIGMYLGIGGVVTFQNSKEIKRVVEGIDLKYIVSETDAPYLAPVPYRGKLNRPKYIREIVEKIAEIKSVDVSVVEKQIEENVKKLFNI